MGMVCLLNLNWHLCFNMVQSRLQIFFWIEQILFVMLLCAVAHVYVQYGNGFSYTHYLNQTHETCSVLPGDQTYGALQDKWPLSAVVSGRVWYQNRWIPVPATQQMLCSLTYGWIELIIFNVVRIGRATTPGLCHMPTQATILVKIKLNYIQRSQLDNRRRANSVIEYVSVHVISIL